MKKLKITAWILFLILACPMSYAQLTPEQQKQAEEAQKKAMEMMKNNPQYEEAMKQMKAAEEQMRQEKMMKQLEEEKHQKDAMKDQLKEYYWRNKVASDTNGKFHDWSGFELEIGYYDGKGRIGPDGKFPYENYVIVGSIDSNGQVQMNLPEKAETNRTIGTGLFPEMTDWNSNDMTYSNPDSPFHWYGYVFAVLSTGKKIGDLYIGNSERTTQNLASPADVSKGDEGYLAYWAYSEGDCEVTYSHNDPNVKIIEGESEKIVDRYVRVDMDLNPGWNLIKIEVNGNHVIGNSTRWKWKTYSTVDAMPSDAKYYLRFDD